MRVCFRVGWGRQQFSLTVSIHVDMRKPFSMSNAVAYEAPSGITGLLRRSFKASNSKGCKFFKAFSG